MNTKIDVLKKKKKALNARIKLVQNRETMKKHKSDTKRKILIGEYYLDQANQHATYDKLIKIMDQYLTRDSDRKAFNLEPLKK